MKDLINKVPSYKNEGEIKLVQIEEGNEFWNLIDELIDDESGFMFNRNILVEAYKNGNLFGLRVNETESMYKRGARSDDIFCKDSYYLLPCFCIKEGDKAIILWVHTKARLNGFAKLLIRLLDIKRTSYQLPESVGFWKKLNIKMEH